MASAANLIFDKKTAKSYEGWYKTSKGRKFDSLEKKIIFGLIRPQSGESILDIGCGTGHHLGWFKHLGLRVTGIDNSVYMLDVARQRLGRDLDVEVAQAQNLPFGNNQFDIVSMITTLEFVEDPGRALREAYRVAKSRLFLGVLNKYSFLALNYRLRGLFRKSIYNYAKFYSFGQLMKMVKEIDDKPIVYWQTVIPWQPRMNKFGAFIGVLIKK